MEVNQHSKKLAQLRMMSRRSNDVTPQQSVRTMSSGVRTWKSARSRGSSASASEGPTPWAEMHGYGGQPQVKTLSPNPMLSDLAVASWPIDPVASATRYRPVPA